ncbi:MAG TPA: TlpA disulfide reductase family protein [Acidimicrobiales bacterium]|nr:TlpA disulfide reductase family protein [Acidimicrobiales bacterium]
MTRGSRRVRTVAVIAASAVLIGALAVIAFRPGRSAGTASATAFDLPALTGGGRVRLADYRGKPVVVTLFASWCTACTTELPGFARAAAAMRGHVQFIGVDSQETGDGAAFAARFGLSQSGMALARDIGKSSTGGLYRAYEARGLPLTVIYGPDGTVRWKAREAVPEAALAQQLAAVG